MFPRKISFGAFMDIWGIDEPNMRNSTLIHI